MNRCLPANPHRPPAKCLEHWLLAALACGVLSAALPVSAQVLPGLGISRPFPDAAKRGTLTFTTTAQAQLNGKPIRVAPGMRLFSPQNTLLMTHSVLGKTFKVNYVLEASTGMLHAAWILTEGEAAKPRKGSDAVISNINTESSSALK